MLWLPDIFSSYLAGAILLFIRLFVAFRLTPFWGGNSIPSFFSVILATLVVWLILPTCSLMLDLNSKFVFSMFVLKEVCVGGSLGILTRLIFSVIFQMGALLGSSTLTPLLIEGNDGETIAIEAVAKRSPLTSLYLLLGTLVFFLTGGHHGVLLAIVGSIKLIPLGGFVFDESSFSSIYKASVAFFSSAFIWAFLVSVPIFISGLLVDFVSNIFRIISPIGESGTNGPWLRLLLIQIVVVFLLSTTFSVCVAYLKESFLKLF